MSGALATPVTPAGSSQEDGPALPRRPWGEGVERGGAHRHPPSASTALASSAHLITFLRSGKLVLAVYLPSMCLSLACASAFEMESPLFDDFIIWFCCTTASDNSTNHSKHANSLLNVPKSPPQNTKRSKQPQNGTRDVLITVSTLSVHSYKTVRRH